MAAHSGGVNQCPFRNLSDADARKKMKFVWEQLLRMPKRNWEKLLTTEE
jgi:hypothetical protein